MNGIGKYLFAGSSNTLTGILVGLLMSVLSTSIQTAGAQETHRNVMADIAFQCFSENASELPKNEPIHFVGSGRAPIVSAELTARLLQDGYLLVATNEATQFDYELEFARVTLKRKGRNELIRTVSIGMTFQIFEPVLASAEPEAVKGRLIHAGTCALDKTDTVQRERVASLGYEGFPETNPDVPAKGGWRRYIKPAVLIGATVVGTYLFFNLRSKRADSG